MAARLSPAATGEPDLVVLDVMLPGRNGFELLRELRARESRLPAYSEAIAQSLSILGTIESELGQLDKAETHLTRSLAIVQSRDRLCTVSRTVQRGADVQMREG